MPDGTQISHITPPDGTSALGKGVTVLAAILNAKKPPSLNDLAELTGLARPTVYRVVRQLEDTMLVTRHPRGDRYVVGPNLMALATDALASFSRTSPTHTILQGLVQEVGETCNLAVLDRDGIVYIDRVECDWPLRLQIGVGTKAPLHATAIGKLMLAYQPSRTRKRILSAAPLERYTQNTMTDAGPLERHLKQIRRHGYATNNEENTPGMIGIAVPVFDGKGRVVAGLSVHAPAARLSLRAAEEYLPSFRNAARFIERVIRDQETSPAAAGDEQ